MTKKVNNNFELVDLALSHNSVAQVRDCRYIWDNPDIYKATLWLVENRFGEKKARMFRAHVMDGRTARDAADVCGCKPIEFAALCENILCYLRWCKDVMANGVEWGQQNSLVLLFPDKRIYGPLYKNGLDTVEKVHQALVDGSLSNMKRIGKGTLEYLAKYFGIDPLDVPGYLQPSSKGELFDYLGKCQLQKVEPDWELVKELYRRKVMQEG